MHLTVLIPTVCHIFIVMLFLLVFEWVEDRGTGKGENKQIEEEPQIEDGKQAEEEEEQVNDGKQVVEN